MRGFSLQIHSVSPSSVIASEDFTDIRKADQFITIMNDLASLFQPHGGQIEVGQALFYNRKLRVFVKCGRKWGKTTMAVYSLFRFAMTYDGSGCYYVAPFFNQARELIWSDRRMQEIGRAHV